MPPPPLFAAPEVLDEVRTPRPLIHQPPIRSFSFLAQIEPLLIDMWTTKAKDPTQYSSEGPEPQFVTY
jgi:hypothetical protein